MDPISAHEDRLQTLESKVRDLERWVNRTPIDSALAEEDGGALGRALHQVKTLELQLRDVTSERDSLRSRIGRGAA